MAKHVIPWPVPPMVRQTTPYGLSTTIATEFTDAVSRAKAALAAEGFRVLAEMNIAAAMRDKLHVSFRDYVILGAWVAGSRP